MLELDLVLITDAKAGGTRRPLMYTEECFQETIKHYLEGVHDFKDTCIQIRKAVSLYIGQLTDRIVCHVRKLTVDHPLSKAKLIEDFVKKTELSYASFFIIIDQAISEFGTVINNISDIDYEYALTYTDLENNVSESVMNMKRTVLNFIDVLSILNYDVLIEASKLLKRD